MKINVFDSKLTCNRGLPVVFRVLTIVFHETILVSSRYLLIEMDMDLPFDSDKCVSFFSFNPMDT